MKAKTFLKQTRKLLKPYCITDKKFRLRNVHPDDTGEFDSDQKESAQELLAAGLELICELQDKLYAQDRWGVLLIFQAMDAAGKDSAIKHVMSGVNPQGCDVTSFKAPSAEELDHDYMWRCLKHMPERGRIGIFNRSYYEETLVLRIHKEFLDAQKIPPELVSKNIWRERFEDISNIEAYLSRNGIAIRKFFLYVSKAEQKKRFLERIDRPEKNWKFSINDVRERERWDDYMEAYEDTIRNTATAAAPWYVVPADHKWFTRLVVAAAVVECLESLDLQYPKLGADQEKGLQAAKIALEQEK